MTVAEDTYLLGSGDLFIGKVDNIATATESDILAAIVNVGAISGGAELVYKPKFYEVKSGNRGTIASFKTDEEVTFKSGILTWDLKNIEKLSASYYSEDTTAGTRRVGVGGMKNIPINYLRFVHTKPDGLKLTVNVFKAQAQSGFSLTFNKEKETVIDAEFKALSVSGKYDGNLVEIIEEVKAPPAPVLSSITPTSSTVAAQPLVMTVTGSGFTQDSVVFIDKIISTVDLNTIYDSPTQLTVIIKGLAASSNTIRVRNGSSYSTASKMLTVS